MEYALIILLKICNTDSNNLGMVQKIAWKILVIFQIKFGYARWKKKMYCN